jgi:glutamate synthase (NADPH/NADH) small chain
VLLAMGYVHRARRVIDTWGANARGNVRATTDGLACYATWSHARSPPATCDAGNRSWGDPRGRQCAREVDAFLMGARPAALTRPWQP